MAGQERIQFPERDEIVERAVGAGVPEDLAGYMGMAGGESHVPSEVYETANYLAFRYGVNHREGPIFPRLLLDHYPDIVVAFVPERPAKLRAEVMRAWEEHQRPFLESVIAKPK